MSFSTFWIVLFLYLRLGENVFALAFDYLPIKQMIGMKFTEISDYGYLLFLLDQPCTFTFYYNWPRVPEIKNFICCC